jgi:hypothetical protein
MNMLLAISVFVGKFVGELRDGWDFYRDPGYRVSVSKLDSEPYQPPHINQFVYTPTDV